MKKMQYIKYNVDTTNVCECGVTIPFSPPIRNFQNQAIFQLLLEVHRVQDDLDCFVESCNADDSG